jgi:hypothetical protein
VSALAASGTTTAIIGVVGTVAGAAVGGASTVVRDVIDDRRRRTEAVRLVGGDLRTMESVVDAALRERRWPPGQAGHTWMSTWAGYSGSVARALDDKAYGAVANAFGRAPALLSGLAAGERPLNPPAAGEGKGLDEQFLETVRDDLRSAIEQIERFG